MKKLAVLLVVAVSALALSSFTTKNVKKENSKPLISKTWKALCADGSVGGYFTCDCSQTRANEIAHVMCN
ncbi:hypothetical protein [Chryseobacterium lathyri]|uniref:hypothetical protein n=1 Tax=Chryseobacterium lathyri TaxID=395933 RepID=UPI002787DB55|nr:hypothetical protein [Chryseobacterium lathyri]MDQ0067358.1 hypothetical protein [Chryseobacterium lathyri]